MKNLITAVSVIMCAFSLTGCGAKDVVGKEPAKAEVRNVAEFNAVKVSGSYNLAIRTGADQKVSIATNADLLPYIVTQVKGDTLYIDNKSSVSLKPTAVQTLNVTVKNIKQIQLDGANTIDAQGINSDELTLKFNGSNKGSLVGTAKDVKLTTAGEATIDAQKLVAEKVVVDISGTANVLLNAAKKLDVTMMGNGKIQYLGKPALTQKIMGSGEITEANIAPAEAKSTTTSPAQVK